MKKYEDMTIAEKTLFNLDTIADRAQKLQTRAIRDKLERDILAACLGAIQAALIMANKEEDKGLVEMIDEAFEATGIKEVKELSEVGL